MGIHLLVLRGNYVSLENQKIYYILRKENINLQFSDSWFSFFPMNLWSVSNWDLNVY